MLRALPENDRLFHMDEENVVDKSGAKCSQIYDELQERYGFLGGSYEEYVRHFAREDVDPTLWEFSDGSDVKCVAGLSCVPKKRPRQATQAAHVLCGQLLVAFH